MEVVAAAVGIADVAARASSKAWKLCDLWRDAPRDIFLLRDDLDRSARFFVALHQGLERRSDNRKDSEWAAADDELASLLSDGCETLEGLQDIMDSLISPDSVAMPATQLDLPKRRRFLWLRRLKEVKKLKVALGNVMSQIGLQLAYLNLSVSSTLPDEILSSETRVTAHVDTVVQASTRDLTTSIDVSKKEIEQHIVNASTAAAHVVIENLLATEARQHATYQAHIEQVGNNIENHDRRLREMTALLVGFSQPRLSSASTGVPSTPTYAKSTCKPTCKCRCHTGKSHGRWRYDGLRHMLGTVQISFSGAVLRQRPCTHRNCKNQGQQGRLAIQYAFPSWASTAIVSLFLARLPEPELLLRVHRQLMFERESEEYQRSIFPCFWESDMEEKIRRCLAARPAAISDVCGGGRATAIATAIMEELDPGIIKLLMQAGADAFQENTVGESAVSFAFEWFLKDRDENTKGFLLEWLPLEQYLDHMEFTPLHKVAAGLIPISVHEAVANPIFEDDISTASLNGITPLHVAAWRSDSVAVQALLEAGAEVDAKDIAKQTPFLISCNRADAASMEFLLQHGARADCHDAYQNAPIHVICQGGDDDEASLRCLTMLLKYHPDVDMNAEACMERTPPICAAGRPALLRVLVERGADLYFPDWTGDDVLKRCVRDGHRESAALLLRAGVDYTTLTATTGVAVDGRSVLHILAKHGDEEMMGLFEGVGLKGLDGDLRDSQGMTPRDVLEQERKVVTPEARAAFESLLKSVRRDGEVGNRQDALEDTSHDESDEDFLDAVEDLNLCS